MAKIIVTLFICFLSYLAPAQTIKIFVVDSISKAQIIGCTVYLTQTDQSFTSNENGFVSFESFSKGFTPVKASALGYSSFFGEVNLDSSITIICLKPKHLDLHEVSVSSGSAVLQNKNPYHVESRKLSDLNAITSVNLGEIIGKIPGVYSASLGNGISKIGRAHV